MKALFASAVLLVSVSVHAFAGSYEDFNTGVAATRRGQYDLAIQMLSRALAAGDLSPSLQPVAYYDRGMSYLAKDQLDAAIADFSNAIRLKPDFADPYLSRGAAYSRNRETHAALADLATAIRLAPGETGAHFAMGRLHWELGQFAEASADFKQGMKHAPSSPYLVLWRHISVARTAAAPSGELSKSARKLNLSNWPGPIVKLFLGRLTPDQVHKAAKDDDTATQRGQDCEANFYVAQWLLLNGRPEEARPLLQSAAASCPQNFIELRAATVELNRLP